jgi:hypothetical protein
VKAGGAQAAGDVEHSTFDHGAAGHLSRAGVANMKAYLVTTGLVFGLLTVVHIWRMIVEGGLATREPWMVLITLFSAVLSAWAARLLMVSRRTP